MQYRLTAEHVGLIHRTLGLSPTGRNLADHEHRRWLLHHFDFTDEDKEAIGYRETPRPDGTWEWQYDPRVVLTRELTERQKAKLLETLKEVMPTLRLKAYAELVTVLAKLGWKPPPIDWESEE